VSALTFLAVCVVGEVASSSKRSQERERNLQKYAQSLFQMNEVRFSQLVFKFIFFCHSFGGHLIYCFCLFVFQLMKGIIDRLPPYQFLIAFSQLISRICHPNSQVFNHLEANWFCVHFSVVVYFFIIVLYIILQEIILKLLENYAQQALWMMIAVSKVIS